jgi:hypothetical protein
MHKRMKYKLQTRVEKVREQMFQDGSNQMKANLDALVETLDEVAQSKIDKMISQIRFDCNVVVNGCDKDVAPELKASQDQIRGVLATMNQDFGDILRSSAVPADQEAL